MNTSTAQISENDAHRRILDEVEGKALLRDFGISTPKGIVVPRKPQSLEELETLNRPLALKIISPDVQHKSDGGYVALRLMTTEDVLSEIERMTGLAEARGHRVEGFLLEEMAKPGTEVIVGGFTDPTFGPAVMFGVGGVYVEVLKDVSFRVCPVSRLDAQDMIAELVSKPILEGARGAAPVDPELLIDLIMAIGGENGAMLKAPEPIFEIDLNPVIVNDTTAVAVDALVVLVEQSAPR